MATFGAIMLIWTVSIICIQIMKKLQPEDVIYPIWTVAICILSTIFLLWYTT